MPLYRSPYAVGNVPGTFIQGQAAIDPLALPAFSLADNPVPYIARFADPLPRNPMLAATAARAEATTEGAFSNIRLGLQPTGRQPILYRPGGLLYSGPPVR